MVRSDYKTHSLSVKDRKSKLPVVVLETLSLHKKKDYQMASRPPSVLQAIVCFVGNVQRHHHCLSMIQIKKH